MISWASGNFLATSNLSCDNELDRELGHFDGNHKDLIRHQICTKIKILYDINNLSEIQYWEREREREREREMSLTWVDGGRVDMNGKCGSKREYVNVWERMKILWKLVFFFCSDLFNGKITRLFISYSLIW